MAPDAEGRVWSRVLGIGFAWQADGRLVRVLTPDGRIVPTEQEEVALRAAAEERAEAEHERAEAERERAEALATEVERLRRAMGEEA